MIGKLLWPISIISILGGEGLVKLELLLHNKGLFSYVIFDYKPSYKP